MIPLLNRNATRHEPVRVRYQRVTNHDKTIARLHRLTADGPNSHRSRAAPARNHMGIAARSGDHAQHRAHLTRNQSNEMK